MVIINPIAAIPLHGFIINYYYLLLLKGVAGGYGGLGREYDGVMRVCGGEWDSLAGLDLNSLQILGKFI